MSRLLDMSQEERNRIVRLKNEFDFILRRLGPNGLDVLLCLNECGPLEKRTLQRKLASIFNVSDLEFPEAYHSCKAYGLVASSRMSGKKTRWVDLTEKGITLIKYYFAALKTELKVNGSKS